MAKNAEAFAQHIKANQPELWQRIKTAQLAGAAVWSWPKTKLAELRFWGGRETPCGGVHGPMLDVAGKRSWGNKAWVGLAKPVKTEKGEVLWARPLDRDADSLVCELNQALAAWLGLPYQPDTLEKPTYGRILALRAIAEKNREALREAIHLYGLEEEGLDVLWAAALTGCPDTVRDILQLWPDSAYQAYPEYDCYHDPEPTLATRRAAATLLLAGLEPPQWCRARVALWLGEAMAQRQ